MPAIARLDRTLPCARFQLEQRGCELWPEFLGDLVRSTIAVKTLEHERVGPCRNLDWICCLACDLARPWRRREPLGHGQRNNKGGGNLSAVGSAKRLEFFANQALSSASLGGCSAA